MESVSPEVLNGLRQSLLAYGLNEEQTLAVAALGQRDCFTAGEHLTVIGGRDADLFVIVEGHINVLTHDGDKLGEIQEGGILGEIAFVDGGPRHAHGVAAGFVTAIRFPARELRSLMNRDRDLGFVMLANLSRLIAARLRNADCRLDTLMDTEHDVWHHAV